MTTSTTQQGFDLSLLRCAAGTDVGMRREENQDAFGVIRHDAFQAFFVADGMGGVKGGAIASRQAISTLQEMLPSLGAGLSPESLSRIIATINTTIFEQGNAQPGLAGMGTTIVGLIFTPDGIISLNVGDSRAYRIRGGAIAQISEDHTLVRELVRSGAISSRDASHHPVSHMLTRSLGPLAEVSIECRREAESPQEGDVYVLCSDGLYNFVNDEEILDVVRQNPIDDANQILINLANRRGGTDNITVVVVSVGEIGGRRRGGEYRKARSTAASEDMVASSSERPADPAAEQVAVAAGEEAVIPPPVAEPKDHHAERESLKERKKKPPPRAQGVPIPLIICGAVLFGLVVGDVARRWGAFPDFLGVFDGGSLSAYRGGEGGHEASKLDQLSKELSVARSQGTSRERLPDIARRVSNSQVGGGSPSMRGARRDSTGYDRAALQSAATKIELKLKELSAPASAASEEALKRAKESLASQVRDLSEIETKIDASSRKLSLWFGRKKKAEESNQDLLIPGGDLERVGAVSERVKRKAAEWTEINYQLQAKQDEAELYPSNDGLRREVDSLNKTRDTLQQELIHEIVRAIDGVLADTYRQLEELKARREILAAQVSTAQDDVDFLQTLTNSGSASREALQVKLEQQLAEIRAAISEKQPE